MASKSSASEAQSLSHLSRLFGLLSDKTRMQILMLLAAGGHEVADLNMVI